MSNLKPAPIKPVRVPTFKQTEKPKLTLKPIESKMDCNEISEARLQNEITAPKSNLIYSVFDLKSYECDIISNKDKHLDRRALIEVTRALLVTEHTKFYCCSRCECVGESSSDFLAKYLTYEDLKVLRFNYDFGLGVSTGLELITLPQGEIIRLDIIERLF
jgi:hypothetical protein